MAYILAVNANILTDLGGPCFVDDCLSVCNVLSVDVAACTGLYGNGTALRLVTPEPECKFTRVNPGYTNYLERTRKDLIMATVASSLIRCFIMGVFANLPLALTPSMGTNAYFAYTVVGFHGSGSIPYKSALAAVLIEGVLFLLIATLGLRKKLAKLVLKPVRISSSKE
ncbi:hypothetical protein KI387_017544 [Taxus chinensis]|uniref:Uncharacterized protein n=1 Tax=Taxus chinensis TaxID=29808 RepID=A0AA38GL04_TAXCH|nr:hypothetical protein KI387_017544 [Taxus chinensis]